LGPRSIESLVAESWVRVSCSKTSKGPLMSQVYFRPYKKQGEGPLPLRNSSPVTHSYAQVLSFHSLAHSFALFCTPRKLNPFLFRRFRTLCTKTPGVGGGGRLLTSHPPSHCSRSFSGNHFSDSVSVNGACPDPVGVLSATSVLIPILCFDFQLLTLDLLTSRESRSITFSPRLPARNFCPLVVSCG
jgi:hypothetical protein